MCSCGSVFTNRLSTSLLQSKKHFRKKNLKCQFSHWKVHLQHLHRKQVEVTNSLITQLLPKSIHAVTATGFELKLFLFIIATNIKQLYQGYLVFHISDAFYHHPLMI